MTLSKITGSQLPVISDAETLEEMFSLYCAGPQGEYQTADGKLIDIANIPVCRSSKLDSEQIDVLNQYMVDHCRQFLVDPNGPLVLEGLLGLVEAGPGDEIFCTIGSTAFKATNNQENRNITESRIGPATKEGTYCFNEAALFRTRKADATSVTKDK